jgi:ATP-dependent DNA ligase
MGAGPHQGEGGRVRRAETRLGPVGEFEFLKWTADKHLRHSKFVGLRGDKNAKAIVRE